MTMIETVARAICREKTGASITVQDALKWVMQRRKALEKA